MENQHELLHMDSVRLYGPSHRASWLQSRANIEPFLVLRITKDEHSSLSLNKLISIVLPRGEYL